MKRWGSVLFIVLLLMPVMAGNAPQSATAPLLEQQAILSVDGSESPESITSFSTTLASDTLFYPDLFHNDTIDSADTGSASGDDTTGSYTDTFSINGVSYGAQSNPSDAYVYLNFTVPSRYIEGVRLAIYGNATFGVYTKDVEIYDFTAETWTDYDNLEDSNAWYNHTTYDPDYWSVDDVVYARIHLLTTGVAKWGYIDYAEVTWYVLHLVDSDHFGESFVDISDWTTDDTSISSDGDVATITENGAGSTGRAYASFSSTDHFEHYYEFRIESMTATTANLEFWDGAAYNTLKTFTAAGTYKGLISDADAATMQRIGFFVGSEGGNIKPDYLRIGPADEMGWQHDCSTTAGVTNTIFADTFESDGDALHLVGTAASYMMINWEWEAFISDTYYQFFELRYKAIIGHSLRMYFEDYDCGGDIYPQITTSATGDWTIFRLNIAALTDIDTVADWGMRDDNDGAQEFWIDYLKFYSIANFTVTQGAAVTTSDYAYVESNQLKISRTTSNFIRFNYDPVLSVNTATYNVWALNHTKTGAGHALQFYVGGWGAVQYSEERGELASGTLTDFYFYDYLTDNVTSLKFIEDGTAPDADIVVSPDPPDDDEQVTLSSIVFDDVEVYKVWYNAISYPAGFSDVDYEATEGQENYWSYSFSSLIAGDYCFKVIANDGANNSTVTQANRDYATARFTVREAAIRLDPINQEGAEPDATHYQVSFVCNKDGDWSVTEWTQTDGSDAAETHTGVVVEGWNNIAWEKLDTDSSVVYFNMTVTNSTLTKTVPGLYLVAQTTFYVDASTTEGLDTVTVTGRITKLGNYLLYDENNELKDSGSITDLDFTIRFTKWSGYDEQDHDFAIKFTNGTQTCWYNSSYYAFKKPVAAAVVTTDEEPAYPFLIQFWTLVAVVAIGAMILVEVRRKSAK